MYYKIFSFLTFVFILSSCGQKTIDRSNTGDLIEDTTEEVNKPTNDASYYGPSLDYVNNIETTQEENLKLKQSLRFEMEGGFVEQVNAFYMDGKLVKAIEKYTEGVDGNIGTKVYYFNGKDSLIAFFHNYDDFTNPELVQYCEKRTYFENQQPVITQYRSTDLYDELESLSFTKIRSEDQSTDTVLDIILEKGRFNPHFIGTIDTGNEFYILLGEPNVNVGYFSAAKVVEKDAFIEDLMQNEEKYMNQPINIKFRVTNGNVRYQIYEEATWN